MCYNFTIICKKIFIYYNLGGKELERREAIELLKKYNEEEFHIRHALTVEGVMIYFAEQMGYNEDFWGLVGLLHDVDFEKYPDEHCKKAPELLKEINASDEMVHAICSHGYGSCSDIKPEHAMEKVLYAVDKFQKLSFYCTERFLYPIRLKSTSLAASLPSRIAHTTKDCPRCISPAVNTFFTFVLYIPASVFTFVRAFTSTPNAFVIYSWLPRNPAAINTRSTSTVYSLPSIGTIIIRPVFSSFFDSSFTRTALHTFPFLSLINSFTVVVYTRGSCPNTAIASC